MSNYSDSSFSKDPNSSWYKMFEQIKPGSKVLDVGCSSGNFGSVLMQEKQCIVDGVELDDKDVALAKKQLRNVYKLNIETDDLNDITDTYDYIYFGDVIEHLVWPSATLARLKHLFAPQGQLLFSIPNMAHLSVRLMLLKGDFSYGETGLLDKTHLHFYTVKEVERILHQAGYTLTNFDPVLKDQPEELLKKELGMVGLKLTPEFTKFTRTTEASIYQIVGSAAPDKKTKHQVAAKLDASSPVDGFQRLLDETKAYYEQQLKQNAAHIKKIEKYAKDSVKLYEEALGNLVAKETEIQDLKNSRVYRASQSVKRRIHRNG